MKAFQTSLETFLSLPASIGSPRDFRYAYSLPQEIKRTAGLLCEVLHFGILVRVQFSPTIQA